MKRGFKFMTAALTALILPMLGWATLPAPAWTWNGDGGPATEDTLPSGEPIYTANGIVKDLGETIPATGFTFSFWIKRTTQTWRNGAGFANVNGRVMFQSGRQSAYFFYGKAQAQGPNEADCGIAVSDSAMQLVTIVVSNGVIVSYVNGTQVNYICEKSEVLVPEETPSSFSISNTTWADLHEGSTAKMRYFGLGCAPLENGTLGNNNAADTPIADARVYNVALTAEQVAALYNDYGARAEANRIFTENDDWSKANAWKYDESQLEAPAANADAAIYVKQDSTITMNAVADLGALTIGGPAKATFVGTNSLTADPTTINTDTDVSGVTGTVGLGAVTIAEGKTLTEKATLGAISSITNNGALRLVATAANQTADVSTRNALKNASGKLILGGETSFTTNLGQIGTGMKIEVEAGSHTLKSNCGAASPSYPSSTDESPALWVKPGATLTLQTKDMIGWYTEYRPNMVIRNSGNLIWQENPDVSGTDCYAGRWVLDNGAVLTIAGNNNDQRRFVWRGGNVDNPNIRLTSGSAEIAKGTDSQIGLKIYNDSEMVVETGTSASDCLIISAPIEQSGTAKLKKTGAGILNLTAANTYAGATTISAGTLRLSGAGTLGTGAVTVDENATLELGADAAVTNAVTINGSVKATGNASMSGALTGSGTITVESGTLDLTRATIANTLKLVVSDGATVIVTKEQLEAFATITTTETATIKFSPDMSLLLCGGTISATLTEGDHEINGLIQVGTVDATYEYEDGQLTMTVSGNSTMTGSNWWWDYEFNGNGDNIGSDGVNLSWDGDRPLKNGAEYTAADSAGNRMLKLPARPWRGVNDWPTEATFVMYTKAGATANGILASFGSSDHGTRQAITLAVGETPDTGAMRLVHTSGMNPGTNLVSNFSVPNSQSAYHLYAFAMYARDEKTHIDVYVDGTLLTTYTFNSVINLGPGFQIASIHGGYANTGLARLANDDTATMDFLRVADEVLTPAAMKALADAYPYVSPNGRATRTVAAEDEVATWIGGEGQTVWTQTTLATDGTGATTDTQQVAPNSGTNVELTVSDTTALAVNVAAEGVTYESLTVSGSGALTLSAAQDTGMITVSGMTEIETNVTVAADVLKVGTVNIADGKTLTFDYSDYDFSAIFEPRMIPLTGLATLGTDAAVAVSLPETLPGQIAAAECVFNENTQEYALSVTIKDGTLTAVVPEAGATWDTLVWKFGETTIDSSVIDFTSLPLVLQGEREGATLTLGRDLTLANLTIEGAKLNLAGAHTLAIPAAGLTTTTALSLANETTLDLTSGDAVAGLTKSIEGTGTVKVKLTPAYTNEVTLTGFTGITHVTAGYLSVDTGSLGETLKLADNTQVQTTKVTADATLNLVLDGTVQFHANADKHYTTTGTISGTKLDKQGGGTLTAAGITSQLALSVGPVVINPGASNTTTLGQLSGGNALTIASGTVTVANANGDYTGTITVDEDASLATSGSANVPFTKGAIVNNGTVIINHGALPPVSGAGNITVAGDATLAGAITTTGTVTVNSDVTATMAASNDYSSSTPGINEASLAVNGTLTVTAGTVTIADEKTLSGTGTVTGTVTFADGATLDASAGALTASSTVTYGGTLTIKVPDSVTDWTTGVCVLKTATTLPTTYIIQRGETTFSNVTLEFKTVGEVAGIYATSNGVVLPEVVVGEEVIEIAESNLAAIQAAAAEAGVAEISSFEGDDVAGLELFGGVDLTVDATGKTVTVNYDFGVLGLTVVHFTEGSVAVPYVLVTSKVKNEADNATYADGTAVNLYKVTKTTETETLTLIKEAAELTVTADEAKAYGLPVDVTEGEKPTYSIPAGVKYLKVPLATLFPNEVTTSSETFSLKVKAEKTNAQ